LVPSDAAIRSSATARSGALEQFQGDPLTHCHCVVIVLGYCDVSGLVPAPDGGHLMPEFINAAMPQIIDVAKMIIGALIAFIIGRWVIGKLVGLTQKGLDRQKLDPTLARYVVSLVAIILNVFLIIAILSIFGVETTSFAALIAAMGLAIGAAWSGMLSNFAAGVFLILFKPFKVGDFVTAGGVTGTIMEIGMFATTINTLANVKTIVGNGKIAGDTIENYSANSFRAVDLRAQLAHGVSPADAIARLKPLLPGIANVLADPAPVLEIAGFNERGTELVVRPFCHNDHYWQVLFDTNKLVADTFGKAGYPVPSVYQTEYQYELRSGEATPQVPTIG
jgi:small conductance mechanosensitive channel